MRKLELYIAEDKAGNIICIDDIKRKEKGYKYYCLECGGELIARIGNHRRRHFAHKHKCDCKANYQTNLHKAFSKIIHIGDKILLPPMETIVGTNNRWVEVVITDIVVEKRIDDIQPDIIIKASNREIFIEIYVTHKVDEIKQLKLRKHNVSTLEIDLSDVDRDIRMEDLRNVILGNNIDKYWLYNQAADKINKEILALAEIKVPRTFVIQSGAYKRSVLENAVDCPVGKRLSRRDIVTGKRTKLATLDDCSSCSFNLLYNPYFLRALQREQHIQNKIDLIPDKEIRDNLQYIFDILCPCHTIKHNGCLCLGKCLVSTFDDYETFKKGDINKLIDLYYDNMFDGMKHVANMQCGLCYSEMLFQTNMKDGGIKYLGCAKFNLKEDPCRNSINYNELDEDIEKYVDGDFGISMRDTFSKNILNKETTGLPVDIYLDMFGSSNRWRPNEPRIRVPNIVTDKLTSDVFYLEIDKDDPQLFDKANNIPRLHTDSVNAVIKFVKNNYSILMMHWNREISTEELKSKLNKVKS